MLYPTLVDIFKIFFCHMYSLSVSAFWALKHPSTLNFLTGKLQVHRGRADA